MTRQPLVSVIIPVHNGDKYLNQCLEALARSSYKNYEIIVVDDASTDNSAEIARKRAITVLQLPRQSGPAAARNYGAQKGQGEILFFIDSDVLVQPNTITQIVTDFLENPNIVAVFGSYDNTPAEKNFLSQYKNLYHHYIHQRSCLDASTFWAGCGAILREIFQTVGGFDQNKYSKPAIEDIELGYRLKNKGYQILLDKTLQVKHLKFWNLTSLLRADIFYRAVPWSKLILENQQMINDLNLQTPHKISAGLVGLSLGILPFSFFKPELLYSILFLLTIIFVLNYELYKFFFNRKGLKFVILAFPLQLLYYFYSGVTFVLCWGIYHLFKRQ